MTTTRAPELHPLLAEADTPSLETLKSRAVHSLSEAMNTLTELLTLVRNLRGVREPDKYAPWYAADGWYKLIEHGEYRAARAFILANHA